jgi:hypothetical protein
MTERFDDMVFLAVLVTAVILIFVVGTNPLVVKVLADLVVAYWAARAAKSRTRGRDEIAR